MKTNVIMISEDREVFGVKVRQESKTKFLSLNDLQEVYTRARLQHGWNERRVDHILSSKENHERIFYLLIEQGFAITPDILTFKENIDNNGIARYLKSIGAYKTVGARHTKTTYINPYIWVLIAMEMNPMLYAKTVIWLTDNLLINRIEAGNMYRGLTDSIKKFNPDGLQYATLAKALNYIVFDKHETGIRNIANQKQLKELEELEKKFAFAVNMGYIKTWDDLLSDLRNVYINKKKNKTINHV